MVNLIPDWMPWMRPAGRLIWAVVLLVIGLVIVAALMHKRPADRKATWAEAMAGAVGVFALMTLAYAVIPHEWITFSDKYLQWDTTKFVFRSNQDVFGLGIVNWPFNMDKKAIRDIIAVVIYGVLFGLNLYLFVAWQKRGEKLAPAADEAPRKSRFGRPLRKGAQTPTPAAAGGAD